MNFDQTSTATPLGFGKEVISFRCPYFVFKVTPTIETESFKARYLLNQWLEFDQNWFSLCYLSELKILQINVSYFEQ